MKQLILPKEYNGEKFFTLSEEDSHYLLRVQRKSIGYSLDIMDQHENRYCGTIISTVSEKCNLELVKKEDSAKVINQLILFQSIPKGKKIDLMIRQAVEIGVTSFVPIMAEHSIPVFKTAEDKKKKRERWEKIVKEATQQSGTKNITKIEPIQTFDEALIKLDTEDTKFTGLFFHQIPLENKTLHNSLFMAENRVILVIGPEGGLSTKEVKLLQRHNFSPTLLGSNILRAETATTFALGAVQMILLEKNNWELKKET
ncbi:MAG: RsmE family RNA methyltransferase [Spirochaetaceae bacterium]